MEVTPTVIVVPPGKVGSAGWQSVLRHFVFPLILPAVVAAVEAANSMIQTGGIAGIKPDMIYNAFIVALGGGVIGWIRQITTAQTPPASRS